jgi:hypothetical protein
MSGSVGAQDVGQERRVDPIGLGPSEALPLTVARHGERIDGIDRSAGTAQAGDQQTARRLDRH